MRVKLSLWQSCRMFKQETMQQLDTYMLIYKLIAFIVFYTSLYSFCIVNYLQLCFDGVFLANGSMRYNILDKKSTSFCTFMLAWSKVHSAVLAIWLVQYLFNCFAKLLDIIVGLCRESDNSPECEVFIWSYDLAAAVEVVSYVHLVSFMQEYGATCVTLGPDWVGLL